VLNRYARAFVTRVFSPLARLLLRARISPDAITVVGTVGVCAGALTFYPRGELFVGTLVITAFVFGDNVDGVMARISGRTSTWGAFLDSLMDRFGDAAIFAGLALWFAGRADHPRMAAAAIVCLTLGGIVSYARARAESAGFAASVGIAERAERLVVVLVVAGLTGLLDLPLVILEVVLWLLALASLITIIQRAVAVYRQVQAAAP